MKKEELNIKPVEKEVSQDDLRVITGGENCEIYIESMETYEDGDISDWY